MATSKPILAVAVPDQSKTAAKSAGKSLADFQAVYDRNYIVPKKIRDALEKLGPDGWENEIEFIKLAQISVTEMARYREQFAAHVVEVRAHGSVQKRVWAGSAKFAAHLRELAG